MNIVVFLGLIITLGTEPVPYPNMYNWEIAYTDGVVETYKTDTHRLTFDCRPGRPFRSRVNANGSQWSSWSTNEMICSPLPGDVTRDCVVGGPDLLEIYRNYGKKCND